MAAAISAALATSASAALIGVGGDGNDCGGQDDAFVVGSIDEPAVSGDFYSGDCSTTAAYGSSPWIIKYDEFEDSATAGQIFINQLFPTIDGSEFEITFSTDFNAGTWTYTPGPGDPVVTAVAAKGGSQYNFYFDADGFTSFDFAAPGSANLSHITFFDTDHSVVPLPAAGWLLVAGMGGLAAMRRRKG
jgi:hypothetical protein